MSPMALLAIVPKPRPVPNMTPVEIRRLAERRLLAEGRTRFLSLCLTVPETIRRTVVSYGRSPR